MRATLAVLATIVVSVSAAGTADGRVAGAEKTKPLRMKEHCVRKSDHARVVRFKAPDGARLLGVTLGKGTVGVALGHEVGATFCNWLPFARTLARQGYRVLAFDFRDAGSSATVRGTRAEALDLDYAGAAAVLRARGATRVVVGGASLGATAALVAATESVVGASAVFSLSAAATWSTRLDADAAAAKLAVPVLYLAAEDDTDFASDASKLYAETAEADKGLLLLPGASHGTFLLRGSPGPQARKAVLDFLAAHTG